MLRLFAALPIPDDVRAHIALMQGGVNGAKWSVPENLHITLTFIGEVNEGQAEDIDGLLAAIRLPAFSLQLKGVGVFADGDRPKVLWLGVSAPEMLAQLKSKIDSILRRNGFDIERHKYIPHLTLARLSRPDPDDLGKFLQAHSLFETEPWRAEDFTLYHSIETKHGRAYDPLVDYALTLY